MVSSFFERAMPHSTGIIKSESSVCTKYLVGERNGREERKRERERERERERDGERGEKTPPFEATRCTLHWSIFQKTANFRVFKIQTHVRIESRNSNIEPPGRYFIFHHQVFSNITFLFASWCYVTACSVIQVEWFSQIRKLYLTSFKGTH